MFVRATGRQIVGDLRYPKYQLQQILDSLTQTRNKDMNILILSSFKQGKPNI